MANFDQEYTVDDLWKAVDTNDEELLKATLDAGCYPDPDGRHYIRPLMVACRDGHANLARMLLDAGAELNLTDDDEWTALMFAASRGDAELVRMLLERGADPLRRDENGDTALQIATLTLNSEPGSEGHKQVIAVFEEMLSPEDLEEARRIVDPMDEEEEDDEEDDED